jgi:hypothetical protein
MGEVMFKNQSNPVTLRSSEIAFCNSRSPESPRIPDDIISNAQPTTISQERLLRDFSQLTHDHTEVIPRLAELVCFRLEDNRAASVHECFERLRWDMHWHMPNALAPLLARVLLYLHPELNGMVKLTSRPIDIMLGMHVSSTKLPGDYARRLEWIDGRPLTEAPPLAQKKPVQLVRPAQGALFEVAE